MNSREQVHVAPVAEVVAVFRAFAEVSWPLPEEQIGELSRRLGWRMCSEPGDRYIEAETAWGVSDPIVEFMCDDGDLSEVSFSVTDVVSESTSWRADLFNDVFVDVLREVTAMLGAPSSQSKGPQKLFARWDLANHGRISLTAIETSVGVDVASAEWAEVNRKMEQ